MHGASASSIVFLLFGAIACDKAPSSSTTPPDTTAAAQPAGPETAPASDAASPAPTPITETEGVLEGLELGDRACYVQLGLASGSRSVEGDFELCPGAPRDASQLVGKKVVFTVERANVLAASCGGNVDCGKSDVVDMIATLSPPGGAGKAVALDDLDAEAAMLLLGKAPRKTSQEWAMDGATYTTWTWPSAGIVLITGPLRSVHSVTCEAPCALKTKLGIAIGSTVDDVKKAYGKQINKRESSATDLVIGDAYGGTFFAIEAGKVSRIFIGTAAE